ncbi:uncharacterized protein LOC131429914 [Malaya genurostris]|uniref:uncharacterized protein LOC131429914 n=1 Tax=Malaya genurostris TaxID=325434 RepID=UPI0026F3EAAA|nr:uncharacterized protein LOC131429914 [Malaya genurostris]XP_058450352.1 uncharacterized protein LOC131429914 [Malaya genurostris]
MAMSRQRSIRAVSQLPTYTASGSLLLILFFTIVFELNAVTARAKFGHYETRYINDFINFTRPAADIVEPMYYDYDGNNPSRNAFNQEYENGGLAGLGLNGPAMAAVPEEQTGPLVEDEITRPPDIYPDPDQIYATFLNKSAMKRNRFPGDENIIKVYSSKSLRRNPQARVDDDGSFDSLNNDMKGHDFIDNIMYIYYGTNGTLRKDLGGNVIVIGAVFALAPQILTGIILFLRNRRIRHFNTFYPICLNLILMLVASNFSFVLGVQATRNTVKCELIAILLHYLHLSTSIWCFIYIYVIYDLIVNECGPKLKYSYLMGYGVPAVYVLFSYASSIDLFELRRYCWMSIQKGMIVSFMIPISFLIILTTVLGTIALKKISSKQTEILCESIESMIESTSKCNDIMYPRLPTQSTGINPTTRSNSYPQLEPKEKCCQEYLAQTMESRQSVVTLPQQSSNHGFSMHSIKKSLDYYDTRIDLGQLSLAELSTPSMASDIQDFTEFKRAIKLGLFFQPIYSICWFLSVIALENVHSCVMPVIYAICLNILNWCMLVRSSNICPFISGMTEETLEKSALDCADSINAPSGIGADNDTVQGSICTDTIPLLCASNPSIINSTKTALTPTPSYTAPSTLPLSRKFSMGSDLDQQTLNFISSNNLKNTWESSVDVNQHVKASDCISTISN